MQTLQQPGSACTQTHVGNTARRHTTLNLLLHTESYGPAAAEVTEMPLWDQPLPSPQYAGYVIIPGTTKHIFYQLFVSEQSPATDPLIVRYQPNATRNYPWLAQ